MNTFLAYNDPLVSPLVIPVQGGGSLRGRSWILAELFSIKESGEGGGLYASPSLTPEIALRR
jgi:hypothetical protein